MEQKDPIPNPETVARAITVLQAQLGLVTGAIDALDRKATLVPPFLVAAAAFLLGPVGTTYEQVQLILIGAAVLTGIASSWCAYKAMAPDVIQLGPTARIVERNVDAELPMFDQRVVQSLAEAIQLTSKTTMTKGKRLSWSLKLAGLTMLLLVLARITGG